MKIEKVWRGFEKLKQEYEFINHHRKHLRDPQHQRKIDAFEKENAGELALHLQAEKQILEKMGMKPGEIEMELKRTAKLFRQRRKYVTKKLHEDRIKEKLFDKYDTWELF